MTNPTPQRKDGTVPVEDEVRRILREAMKRSGKRRDEIARQMTEALRRLVTGSMLADFTRNGTKKRQVRFPAGWVCAFCEVVGDDALQRHLMGERLRQLLELGERVSNLGSVLGKMQDELARLTSRGARKKAKGRRTRKA